MEREPEEAKRMAEEFLEYNCGHGLDIDGNYAKFCQERRLEKQIYLIVVYGLYQKNLSVAGGERHLEYRINQGEHGRGLPRRLTGTL